MKKIMAILLCAALIASFTGCGKTDEGEVSQNTQEAENQGTENTDVANTDKEEETAKEDYKFAIIIPTSGNEYFQGEIDALQAVLDEYGYELNVISYDMDATKQVSSVENLITMGVDAALIFPMDKESVDTACKSAMDAGVKIISGGIALDNMNALYNTDQVEAGNTISGMGCDYIKETYGDNEVEVAMLVDTSNSNMATRSEAMKETLAKECPNALLVKEIEANDTESGMSAAENIIQGNPDVKVVICINDASALGVVEAYKAANVTEIAVFGSDGTAEGLKKISEGESLKGTIAFGAINLGEQLIKLAKEENVDELLSPPIIKITESNVAEYMAE